MEVSNPYADFGGTVVGPRFVGRENELRIVSSRIFGRRGFGSIAVVGLPRIGKTSLVSEAVRRAEQESSVWLGTVVSRTNVGTAGSVDGLFRQLITDLGDSIRTRELENAPIERCIGEVLQSTRVDFPDVRKVFREFQRQGIRPVCVLDEFDAGRRVFENQPQCFHWLREICSNPEFKAALVLVTKRRLQDVARLAGHESNYWANVLMTLPLKPLTDSDIQQFFLRLKGEGVTLSETAQASVLGLCGGHPFLLESFAYNAWDLVRRNKQMTVQWINEICRSVLNEYFEQVSSVLSDGPTLSKAVQVFVGPQWDVTSVDVDDLCEIGIAKRDPEGELLCFSTPFEEFLHIQERSIDAWTLWRETERELRIALEHRLTTVFGEDWSSGLCRARPKFRKDVEDWRDRRTKEQGRLGVNAELSLLAYTYPNQLYELMSTNWVELGAPLLGSDRRYWAPKFELLARVRTPLAHNRSVSEAERDQARGICKEVLDLCRRFVR